MPFTLTIKERNHSWAGRGPVRSVHATRPEAEAELEAYVDRNWDPEVGTDRPDDAAQMVRDYFADVLEEYEIREGNGPVEGRKDR